MRYRSAQGISGPLFLGRDTHALSGPAFRTAVEVSVARGVEVVSRFRGRLHADPGDLARDPHLQRSRGRQGGRDRDHAVAQSARGRRLQVQPATRRPGRHRRHRADPGRCQRAVARGPERRGAAADYDDAIEARPAPRLPLLLRRRAVGGGRPARDRRSRDSGSASIRSVARASPTGRRSPSATGSTSRWSTTGSTRRSRSCRSTTTARSAWTAPRPTRWRV